MKAFEAEVILSNLGNRESAERAGLSDLWDEAYAAALGVHVRECWSESQES